MGKYFGILALSLLLFSCEDPLSDIPDYYTLEVDGRLDTTAEGLYKLKLSSGQYSAQTIDYYSPKRFIDG